MFNRARKEEDHWLLFNRWSHAFRLPAERSYAGRGLTLGVLGTRTREPVRGPRTALMAQMLAAQQQPLYLLDTRRNGTGAQSSWSPREFASLIPQALPGDLPYAFLHLPCLAPSLSLLDDWRKDRASSWPEFRDRYRAELSEDDLDIGRAFVESAAMAGGLVVFLCAEADQPDFDHLPVHEQNEHYCHRFTLARAIVGRLRQAYGDVPVRLAHLDMLDFQRQIDLGGRYEPRMTEL